LAFRDYCAYLLIPLNKCREVREPIREDRFAENRFASTLDVSHDRNAFFCRGNVHTKDTFMRNVSTKSELTSVARIASVTVVVRLIRRR
jgi:hypothetical protein